MKPHVICHSLSSVDGRIQPTRWNLGKTAKVFETTAKKIKVDAWIVGRTTMEEFSSKKAHRLGKPDRTQEQIDFVGRHEAKTYAVGIDPTGKTRWDSNLVEGDHVILVLTENVSTAVLRHLQEKQVSYVFAGKKKLHLKTALRKLHQLFGIKRCRVDGGGTVNGSFLKAGLIDEFSHLVVPIADGAKGVPTSFDIDEGHTRRLATKLLLKSVKRLPGGVLWVRYRVKNG
jgi:2,5-diamino-6-(ribosylamino)-4(3H)-pyrimidinone 5'-phosphate reductase